MKDLIQLASQYQGIIVALATVIIAMAAVITTRLTAQLARENQLLRKAGTEPKVVAYLTSNARFETMLDFVLANVGEGPARNVRFTIEADNQDFTDHEVSLGNKTDRTAISILPQGERIAAFFGGSELFREPRLRPFSVRVKYEDINGICHSGKFVLDVSQFLGFITLGVPAEREVADAVKKIEGHIRQIISGGIRRLSVEVTTSAEVKREREEMAKRAKHTIDEKKKNKPSILKDEPGADALDPD